MASKFDFHGCFSLSYEEARERFRETCRFAGAQLEVYENPHRGPDGRPLTTDVGRFGPASARRLLLLVSGTHGNEGRCGSGCQIAWVREGGPRTLPDDTAVVLVHYINPYGGAYLQRETEENVDLNRNFLGEAPTAFPENKEYEELHPALTCAALTGPERERADAAIADFQARNGMQVFLNALARGQYTRPDGLFFGGRSPTWANRTFTQILERHAESAHRIAVIDYHSGFGPYGYGMLVTTSPMGSDSFARAHRWYGDSLTSLCGQDATQVPPEVRGSLVDAVVRIASHAEVTAVAVEYGTYDLSQLLELRRAEMALKHMRDPDPELVMRYKRDQEKFLIPGTPDWTEMVWARSRQLIRQALSGLAS
jgi:hypothetical protein